MYYEERSRTQSITFGAPHSHFVDNAFLENLMTTHTPAFEFALAVDGTSMFYLVNPVLAEDGQCRKLSIWNNPPAAEVVAEIEVNPELFHQFALPNVETFCRIAIAQAAIEGAFEQERSTAFGEGVMLDFAIEPWEGELEPV
jgi:hypothetical protein